MGTDFGRPPWTGEDDTTFDAVPAKPIRNAVVAGLNERFPDTPCWWGQVTRHYWAMVPVGIRAVLVEAETPDELAAEIERARQEWRRIM